MSKKTDQTRKSQLQTGERAVKGAEVALEDVDLKDGEQVLAVQLPSPSLRAADYAMTFGLYGKWRKHDALVVTDQRVIRTKGIVSQSQQSVPLRNIQQASSKKNKLTEQGSVAVTSATGAAAVQGVEYITGDDAKELAEIIEEAAEAARAKNGAAV